MFNDLILFAAALFLTGLIYGSISGYSIYCGGNLNRKPIDSVTRVALIVFFPFTLAAIASSLVIVWVLKGDWNEANS